MHQSRFRIFVFSWISLAGVIILIFSFVIGAALFLMDLATGFHSPYSGLLVYLGVPALMLFSVFLIGVGHVLTRRRRKKAGGAVPFPFLDLSDARTVRRLVIGGVVLLALFAFSGVAGLQAVHYSESPKFCGELCHEVMKPQYVAFKTSPHANISCAHCHVGPGTDSFIKAKLSGLNQVQLALRSAYPRPVKIHPDSLRPANETCTECHWPRKDFGTILKSFTYYAADESNSPWTINLHLDVGGWDPDRGPMRGIHGHMSVDRQIEYVSMDDEREEILWIRVLHDDGREVIYRSEEDPVTDKDLLGMVKRRMDCTDCHNRAGHKIHSPNKAIDRLLRLGLIDRKIPNIKATAADLLTGEYKTAAEGLEAIEKGLREKYQNLAGIDGLVAEVQDVYSKNFFPEMNVDWRVYPDNIGHKISPGCFRCHDDKHVSEDGKKLVRDCETCHTIVAQGPGEAKDLKESAAGSLEFKHPEDIDGEWKTENCSLCHEGVPM